MARPMPPLAPVTMATLLSLMISSSRLLHRPLLQRSGVDAPIRTDRRRNQLLERAALDFLRRGQRQRRHKRDIAGRLVIGEAAQAPGDEIGGDLLACRGVRGGSLA